MNLYIFSEDLRIRDNKALYEASLEQKGLIALYIINKGKNEEHGDSLAKLKLKLLALAEIRNHLVSLNIPIKILHSQDIKDEPKEILGFCKKNQITNIFLNSEYPFNEQQRNKKLEILCNKNEINLKMQEIEKSYSKFSVSYNVCIKEIPNSCGHGHKRNASNPKMI